MSCLILGEMKALTPSQKIAYSQAVSLFVRIQKYNKNIQNKRRNGETQLTYYTFANSSEKTTFVQGQFILTQNDPNGIYATSLLGYSTTNYNLVELI